MSLIYNISQIQAVSTINVSNTLRQWQPYIDEAQETFLKPFLGEDLIENMKESIDSSASGISKYSELLEKAVKPLALYALYLGIDEMAVSISGSGVQVVQTNEHKPAPQYMVMNLKERFISRAHRNMDLLLDYLDKNKSKFTEYHILDDDLFIRSTREFQEQFDIKSSRRVFLALKPIIRSIEKKYIKPTLSPNLFDSIKSELQASSSLSDDSKKLLELIRPALVHLAMARALQDLNLIVLDWGIFASGENTFDNLQGTQSANAAKAGAMIDNCQRDGEAELKELQEYLDNNASKDKYAAYYNSDRYMGPDRAVKRNEFENTTDKGIFLA
jgi:hypothetical protein